MPIELLSEDVLIRVTVDRVVVFVVVVVIFVLDAVIESKSKVSSAVGIKIQNHRTHFLRGHESLIHLPMIDYLF